MLPVDFEWEHQPGMTLLDDAAHLMTPFIGEGVNAAMRDALELSDAIATAGADVELLQRNVRGYEGRMNSRVTKIQLRTRDMMKMMLFTRGAPETTIERWIIRSVSDDLSSWVLSLFRALVFVLYFLYRRILSLV